MPSHSQRPHTTGSGNNNTPIDALDLINFQAAMLANQEPDVDHVNPEIAGVTYNSLDAQVFTNIPMWNAVLIGTEDKLLMTIDSDIPDGTSLAVTIPMSATTGNGAVQPRIFFGSGIPDGSDVDTNSLPTKAFTFTGAVISATWTLRIYNNAGVILTSLTCTDFPTAPNQTTAAISDSDNSMFTLANGALEIRFAPCNPQFPDTHDYSVGTITVTDIT